VAIRVAHSTGARRALKSPELVCLAVAMPSRAASAWRTLAAMTTGRGQVAASRRAAPAAAASGSCRWSGGCGGQGWSGAAAGRGGGGGGGARGARGAGRGQGGDQLPPWNPLREAAHALVQMGAPPGIEPGATPTQGEGGGHHAPARQVRCSATCATSAAEPARRRVVCATPMAASVARDRRSGGLLALQRATRDPTSAQQPFRAWIAPASPTAPRFPIKHFSTTSSTCEGRMCGESER